MKQLICNFLKLFITGIFLSGTVSAQSYVDGYLTHAITVHYPGHTIKAHVKPAEHVSLSNDKWYYWFSGNLINSTQGGYSGKLLNGDYQDYYMNKNLKEAGLFDKGLKNGNWKSWMENGILTNQYYFKEGKKDGLYLKYDSTGRISEKGYYANDLLSGKQETVTADSTRVIYYKDGKIIEKKSIIPKFIYKILPKKAKKQ